MRGEFKWLYTMYDNLNRPIKTGIWSTPSDFSRTFIEDYAAATINFPIFFPNTSNEILTETYYDDYGWVSGTSSGLSNTFISTYAANTAYFHTASNSTFPYPQGIAANYQVSGMQTGSKVKVLDGGSTYLYSAIFYDDRGRVIQTHSTNYSGGKDTVTNQYGFEGMLLRTLLCHNKAGTNAQKYKMLTKNEYSPIGNITKISKKFDNSPETVIAEYSYDDLGRLFEKKLGRLRNTSTQNTYTSTPVDTLHYLYNIRGWLQSMNKSYTRGTTDNRWFGFELAYDYGFTESQLNGNIAGIRWRSNGDGEQRAYGFTYDASNRFLKADFTQYTSSAWNTMAGIDFTVKDMSYDQNGNILSMTQKGWKLAGSSVIDSLVYGYNSNSNKLNYVTDKTNNTATLLGDFKETTNNTSQDYNYNPNGSMAVDKNKAIDTIIYNHLNLPVEIVMDPGIPTLDIPTISYTYDAAGNKLKKEVQDYDPSNSYSKNTVTLYMGDFVYGSKTTSLGGTPEPDDHTQKLQYVLHEEGRLRPRTPGNSDTMYYDYFEKDHLGNVRVVLTDELKTDAYPMASMESATIANESIFYSNLDYPRTKPGGMDDHITSPDDYAAVVTAARPQTVIGPAITLKVMAGDKFNLRVSSYWDRADVGTPVSPLPSLLDNLNSGIGNLANGHGGVSGITSSNILEAGAISFLGAQTYNSSYPKAYINWILFDEQFKYVASCSGYEQVGADEVTTIHSFINQPITKSGYLFIYTSNEDPDISVFYDNFQVTHIRGPLLEESHYYPFGLTMAGISSKALEFGEPENKKKFNKGTELNTDFDISLYETQFRSYDPQIGRFHQIDKLGEIAYNWSGYVFASNNPILRNDPLGLKDTVVNGEKGETKTLENVTVTGYRKRSNNNNVTSQLADFFSFKFGGPGAGTLPMPRSGTGTGAGAGAGAFGLGLVIDYIDQHWDEINTSIDETINTAILSIISDPAFQAYFNQVVLANLDAVVSELNKLPGSDHQVYNLVAAQPTIVPELKWGKVFTGPIVTVNQVSLNTGEIAKIGITSKPLVIGPSTLIARYSQVKTTALGLTTGDVRYVKNRVAARFVESTWIIRYAIANGKLPPMNTMFR